MRRILLILLVIILGISTSCTAADPVVNDTYYQGTVYIWDGAAWVALTGAGSGDVVGPAGATDSAIALYDTNTGEEQFIKLFEELVGGTVVFDDAESNYVWTK